MNRLRVTHSRCKYLRNCAVFLLSLALLSSFAVFAESGSTINGPSTGGRKVIEPQQREPNGQGRHRAQVFVGDGARLRAHQLQSSNRAIARAMKDFEKRGKEPKWDQSLTVLEADSNSASTFAGPAIRRVSYPQTWSDGSYELTVITYSNSSSQWEGIVYLHNPYEDDVYAALITTPATAEWDTVYEAWYPPDGGDPTCGGGYCELSRLTPGMKSAPRTGFINASNTTGPLARRGFFGRIKQWVGCVWRNRGLIGLCDSLWCALQAIGFLASHC